MPSSPIAVPFQAPVVAIATAPGLPSDGSQHPGSASEVVVAISGRVHHVATRSDSPPNIAETICHGGTFRWEGLEIKTTPPDSLSLVAVRLFETSPRPWTSA